MEGARESHGDLSVSARPSRFYVRVSCFVSVVSQIVRDIVARILFTCARVRVVAPFLRTLFVSLDREWWRWSDCRSCDVPHFHRRSMGRPGVFSVSIVCLLFALVVASGKYNPLQTNVINRSTIFVALDKTSFRSLGRNARIDVRRWRVKLAARSIERSFDRLNRSNDKWSCFSFGVLLSGTRSSIEIRRFWKHRTMKTVLSVL